MLNHAKFALDIIQGIVLAIMKHVHATEYRFSEEYIHYENFRHGEPYHFPCPWADCKWNKTWSVNFDLMMKVDDEE